MLPRNDAVDKIFWRGVLLSVQPQIRMTRSFDQRSHTYLQQLREAIAIPASGRIKSEEVRKSSCSEGGRSQSRCRRWASLRRVRFRGRLVIRHTHEQELRSCIALAWFWAESLTPWCAFFDGCFLQSNYFEADILSPGAERLRLRFYKNNPSWE